MLVYRATGTLVNNCQTDGTLKTARLWSAGLLELYQKNRSRSLKGIAKAQMDSCSTYGAFKTARSGQATSEHGGRLKKQGFLRVERGKALQISLFKIRWEQR